NEFAAADRRSAGNVLTCQHTGIGDFGVGTTASSCLRNSAATRCSMATVTPAPRPAADHAAVWFGKTWIAESGTFSARNSLLVSVCGSAPAGSDRKSTRLNSSHVKISYAVFCLQKQTQ